jgi:hypothetical protein
MVLDCYNRYRAGKANENLKTSVAELGLFWVISKVIRPSRIRNQRRRFRFLGLVEPSPSFSPFRKSLQHLKTASWVSGEKPDMAGRLKRLGLSLPITVACVLIGVLLGLSVYTFWYGQGGSYFSNDPTACVNLRKKRFLK